MKAVNPNVPTKIQVAVATVIWSIASEVFAAIDGDDVLLHKAERTSELAMRLFARELYSLEVSGCELSEARMVTLKALRLVVKAKSEEPE